ncbi:MAG: hypothetical protein H8E12_14340 [Rhodobacteraceae bacterium]|nr:hypothetical protein [Paracoccaceae bacterium]
MSVRLQRLRLLTDELNIRDQKKFKQLDLYHAFFENIPVNTLTWSVDVDCNIAVKGKSLSNDLKGILPNGTIHDMYTCDKTNSLNIDYHKKAFKGDRQTYLVQECGVTFLTTLIPLGSQAGVVVHGCLWDVTNLVELIKSYDMVEANVPEDQKQILEPLRQAFAKNNLLQLVRMMLSE